MTNDKPPVAPVEAEWDKLDQLMLAYEEAGEGNNVDSVIHAYSAMFSKKQVLRARMIEWEQRLASLEALIPLADAACDYADQNCRWFDISTAPKDQTKILVTGPDNNGGVYMDVCAWPENWTGKWPVAYMAYAAGEPTHWAPLPPPPSNPPLPAVFVELGRALEKIKGAG